MAKVQSSIGVNEGSGPQLSTFEHTSGRHRQTAIIADAEDESLLVELPSHGSVDRGSSLKIGGQARNTPTLVTINDRTDAWFTTAGALAVVNTIEPRTVYDGGRQAIANALLAGVVATTPQILVPSGAATRVKVLGIHAVCSNLTTPGSLFVRDGPGLNQLVVNHYTTTGATTVGFGPSAICQTAVGNDLMVASDGSGTFWITVTYYRAA